MPLPGSSRRHTRVVGTVVQRHRKRDELVGWKRGGVEGGGSGEDVTARENG